MTRNSTVASPAFASTTLASPEPKGLVDPASQNSGLPGFDARWTDLPDFIIGVTRDIWEDRNVHSLRRYYGASMVVRSPASIVVGNTDVIAATMATLAEFPDRRLLGEDVVWMETEDKRGSGGYLSSHRLLCTASHDKPGIYGQPTGSKLRYRILADCAARDDAIYDEWLVRDQGAIVRQIGWEPKAYAADLIAREGGPEHCVTPFHPSLDRAVEYTGTGNGHALAAEHSDMLTRMMDGEMSVIKRNYDRAAHLELPGHKTEHGRAAADEFWMGLRASFPDATFAVHHAMGREDIAFSPRTALRWSLTGKHSGWGTFGAPSGAEVHVMGITHAEFGPWGLRREYTLYDETAIWKQILLATG